MMNDWLTLWSQDDSAKAKRKKHDREKQGMLGETWKALPQQKIMINWVYKGIILSYYFLTQ